LGTVLRDVDLLFVEGQFLRPDFLYGARRRADGDHRPGVEATPALVVEVLSPSSRAIDLVKKPRRYRDFGVPEYWVAEPGERIVHRFAFGQGAAEAVRVDGTLRWQPEASLDALEIDLEKAFRTF
jgi:Uma2 family endonuclease